MWPDRRFFGVFLEHQKTKKNTFFEKRTGEVVENKGSGPKSEPDRTEKRSGEVVENTFLWKKRTENEPENKAADSLIRCRRKSTSNSETEGAALDIAPPATFPACLTPVLSMR